MALLVCALASVAPLFLSPFLPFSDIPEQVAVIATLRHWGDPLFSAPYVLDVGKSQYVLYHVVGALLAVPLGSAERANLALLAIIGVTTPFAMRALLKALGRDERLALFAVAPFWSRPLMMGFLPYVASMPLVTYGLTLAVRQWSAPRRSRALGLAALTVALFFLHVDPFVLFVLAVIATRSVRALAHDPAHVGARARLSGRLLGAARDTVWLAPALAIAATWSAFGSLRGSVDQRHVFFMNVRELVREFPSWSHDVFRSHVDEACSIVTWLAFAALVVQRGRGSRDRLGDATAAAPFAAAAICYLALPFSVGAAVMLNVRIAVFVVLFAPLLIEKIDGARGAVPLAAVFASNIALAGGAAYELRQVAREEVGDVARLLDRIPAGARVLTLPFHMTSPRMHWAPWNFFGAYHRARRGGVASFSFTELAHWPLHYKPEAAPPPKPLFWNANPCLYRNEIDGAYYDFIIVRGNVDPFRDRPPGPVFRAVDAERQFVLYARTAEPPNPGWGFEDRGPCESRRSLDMNAGSPSPSSTSSGAALPLDISAP